MNNNLTAETKLEIINLITQSQTKQELKSLATRLLNRNTRKKYLHYQLKKNYLL
ncbi:MAG: hypothetical protein L6V91_00375 [Bacilli bacterium]|nr:MAG: hypothetical protein L6V91_00375 [Bacilli bacterium]